MNISKLIFKSLTGQIKQTSTLKTTTTTNHLLKQHKVLPSCFSTTDSTVKSVPSTAVIWSTLGQKMGETVNLTKASYTLEDFNSLNRFWQCERLHTKTNIDRFRGYVLLVSDGLTLRFTVAVSPLMLCFCLQSACFLIGYRSVPCDNSLIKCV